MSRELPIGTSRRTVLAALGLAPAGVALGAESFRDGPQDRLETGAGTSNQAIAGALRKLADNIESGAISVFSLDVHSRLAGDVISQHDLTVTFAYLPDNGAVVG